MTDLNGKPRVFHLAFQFHSVSLTEGGKIKMSEHLSPWNETETSVNTTTFTNSSSDIIEKNHEKKIPLSYVTKSYRSPKQSGSSFASSGPIKKIKRVPSSMKVIETDPQSISIGPSIHNSECTHITKGSTRISHSKGVLVDLLGSTKKRETKKSSILISTSKTAAGRRTEDSMLNYSVPIRTSSSCKNSTLLLRREEQKADVKSANILSVRGIAKRDPRQNASEEHQTTSEKNNLYEDDEIDHRNDLSPDTKEEKMGRHGIKEGFEFSWFSSDFHGF